METHNFFRQLILLITFFLSMAHLIALDINAEISITENGYNQTGKIRVEVSSDTIIADDYVNYYFKVNDYSMIQLIVNNNIRIQRDGSFVIDAQFPDTFEIVYYPLAGNDTVCIVELVKIETSDTIYQIGIADTISFQDNFARAPFVRPDLFGDIYPNPVIGNKIYFEMETDVPTYFDMTFTTVDGRVILGKRYEVVDKGLNTYSVELPRNLASANYFITVSSKYGRRGYLVSYYR